jgi:hypothetical protein
MKSLFLAGFLVACTTAPPPLPDPPKPPAVPKKVFVLTVPKPVEDDFSLVIGEYTTSFVWGARGRNIERAASFFKGVRLGPKEVLSFNALVGPRTRQNGFRKAPVIYEGAMVDGDGGGTCQVSSTLHGAAVMAGLTVVERTSHSRPSKYIKLGLDATVVYPGVDLKLRNDLDEPVLIVMEAGPKKCPWCWQLHVEVRGSYPLPAPEYATKSQVTGPFEHAMRTVTDKPEGYRAKAQEGSEGKWVTSTLTRHFPDGGVQVATYRSVYAPTKEIWDVGPNWTGPAPWE